ncbi:hypothetical protein F5144DRAFT_496380 [Chaetomium tenue]|uniref:Uncharacterized protein n=1 Tax=Chaetomium tenue TaxID=1854479 RepID=A0ACB7P207_9PEZI|nr:hypothetical protein F5144DRAFT_496380 [Chaetomium globosum]
MSWTRVLAPYEPFNSQADAATRGQGLLPKFPVTIWEVTDAAPVGRRSVNGLDFRPDYLDVRARIRIIFAPLDEMLGDLAPGITALCMALSIPPEFLTERLRGVCHSFGTRTNEQGFAAWFHYLCKAVGPAPAARYSWYKSAFFLRKDQHGNVTLVLFGPTPGVRERLDQFIEAQSWHDVEAEPLALFDLVLDGLFREIDMARVIQAANARGATHRATDTVNFAELHSWTKHLIHLGEAVDSCLLVVDGSLASVGKKNSGGNSGTEHETMDPHEQAREMFRYRRSLFNSTKLRLSSLHKRVDNTTTLAFNLVTQQDSQLMIKDSASVTIISFITVLFLPTAGVAAVVGSQLFVTDFDKINKTIEISTSPLFATLWWIAIPLTMLAIGMAVCYRLFIARGRPSFAVFMRQLNIIFGGVLSTSSVENRNHQGRLP